MAWNEEEFGFNPEEEEEERVIKIDPPKEPDDDRPYYTTEEIGELVKIKNLDDVSIQRQDSELLGQKWLDDNPDQTKFRMFEPTLGEQLKYPFLDFYNKFVKVDVPFFGGMLAAETSEELLGVEKPKGVSDIFSGEWTDALFSPQTKTMTSLMAQSIFDYKDVKDIPKDIKTASVNYMEEVTKEIKKQEELDTRYKPWKKWNEDMPISEFGLDDDGVKIIARVLSNTAASVLSNYGLGIGASLINPALGIATVLGQNWMLEGADEFRTAYDYHRNPEMISNDEYDNLKNSFIKSKTDEWVTNKELNPQGNEPTYLKKQQWIEKFDEDNFDTSTLNEGYVTRFAMSEEEAMDASLEAATIYASLSSILEYFPGIKIMNKFGAKGRNKYNKKLLHTILKKTKETTNRIAKQTGIKSRLSAPAIFADGVKLGGIEALTEFAQYNTQIMVETLGPAAYKNETFSEEYDWNVAIESAVGGFFGGKTMSVTPDIINKSGLLHRVQNFSKRIKPGKNNIVVKKDPSDKKFKLVFNNKFRGAEINNPELRQQLLIKNYKEDLLKDENNEEFSFNSFREAAEVANNITGEMGKYDEQLYLHYGRKYLDATIKLEESEDGKFKVNIYNKEGKFEQTVDTFDSKKAANNTLKIAKQNINTIKVYDERYSSEDLDQNPIISAQNRIRDLELGSTNIKDVNLKNIGLLNNRSLSSDKNLLRAFNPDNDMSNLSEQDMDEMDNLSKDYNINEDSSIIKEIIDGRGGSILHQVNWNPTDFVEELTNSFGSDDVNVQNIISSLEQDELIPPQGRPIEEGPPVEDKDITYDDVTKSDPLEGGPDEAPGKNIIFGDKGDTPKDKKKLLIEKDKQERKDFAEKLGIDDVDAIDILRENNKDSKIESWTKPQKDLGMKRKDGTIVTVENATIEELKLIISNKEKTINNQKKEVKKKPNNISIANALMTNLSHLRDAKNELAKRGTEKLDEAYPGLFEDEAPRPKRMKDMTVKELKSQLSVLKLAKDEPGVDSTIRAIEAELENRGEDVDDTNLKQLFEEDIIKKIKDNWADFYEVSTETDEDNNPIISIDKEKLGNYIANLYKLKNPEIIADKVYLQELQLFFHERFKDKNGKPIFKVKQKYLPQKFWKGNYNQDTGEITINTAYATKDTPFHEFSHPILLYIDTANPELFDKLYDDIVKTKYGKKGLLWGSNAYPDADWVNFKGIPRQYRHEVFAQSLAYMADSNYVSDADKNIWQRIIDFILTKILKLSTWQTMKASEVLTGPDVTIEKLVDVISNQQMKITINDLSVINSHLVSTEIINTINPNVKLPDYVKEQQKGNRLPFGFLDDMNPVVDTEMLSKIETTDIFFGEILDEAVSSAFKAEGFITNNEPRLLKMEADERFLKSKVITKHLQKILTKRKVLGKGKKLKLNNVHKVSDIGTELLKSVELQIKDFLKNQISYYNMGSMGDSSEYFLKDPAFKIEYSDDGKEVTFGPFAEGLLDTHQLMDFSYRVTDELYKLGKVNNSFAINSIEEKFMAQDVGDIPISTFNIPVGKVTDKMWKDSHESMLSDLEKTKLERDAEANDVTYSQALGISLEEFKNRNTEKGVATITVKGKANKKKISKIEGSELTNTRIEKDVRPKFGKEREEIPEFVKWLRKRINKGLVVKNNGEAIKKSMHPHDLAFQFKIFMNQKYPIYGHSTYTYSEYADVSLSQIYVDRDWNDFGFNQDYVNEFDVEEDPALDLINKPKRMAFFSKNTLLNPYSTMHNFPFTQSSYDLNDEKIRQEIAPLFWYAFEKTPDGDIVLYEFQSDMYDESFQEADNSSKKDIEEQYSQRVKHSLSDRNMFKLTIAQAMDSTKNRFRKEMESLPKILKESLYLDVDINSNTIFKTLQNFSLDELQNYSRTSIANKTKEDIIKDIFDSSKIFSSIVENKYAFNFNHFDYNLTQDWDSEILTTLLYKHAQAVYDKTKDANKAISSWKDIFNFKIKPRNVILKKSMLDKDSKDYNPKAYAKIEKDAWAQILHEYDVDLKMSQKKSDLLAAQWNIAQTDALNAMLDDVKYATGDKRKQYAGLIKEAIDRKLDNKVESFFTGEVTIKWLYNLNVNEYSKIQDKLLDHNIGQYSALKQDLGIDLFLGSSLESIANSFFNVFEMGDGLGPDPESIPDIKKHVKSIIDNYLNYKLPKSFSDLIIETKLNRNTLIKEAQKAQKRAEEESFITKNLMINKESIESYMESLTYMKIGHTIEQLLGANVNNKLESDMYLAYKTALEEQGGPAVKRLAEAQKEHAKFNRKVIKDKYMEWALKHAVMHAQTQIEPGKKIYLNTAASIHKIEQWMESHDPFHIYKNVRENDWYYSKKIFESLTGAMRIGEDENPFDVDMKYSDPYLLGLHPEWIEFNLNLKDKNLTGTSSDRYLDSAVQIPEFPKNNYPLGSVHPKLNWKEGGFLDFIFDKFVGFDDDVWLKKNKIGSTTGYLAEFEYLAKEMQAEEVNTKAETKVKLKMRALRDEKYRIISELKSPHEDLLPKRDFLNFNNAASTGKDYAPGDADIPAGVNKIYLDYLLEFMINQKKYEYGEGGPLSSMHFVKDEATEIWESGPLQDFIMKNIKEYFNQPSIAELLKDTGVSFHNMNLIQKFGKSSKFFTLLKGLNKIDGVEVLNPERPRWSTVPLYEIKVKPDSDLTPKFYQKIVSDIENSSKIPSNMNDMEDMIKYMESNRKMTTRRKNRIFKNAWLGMQQKHKMTLSVFLGTSKTITKMPDPQEFRVTMLELLQPNLREDFKMWFKSFFSKDKLQKIREKEAKGSPSIMFMDHEDVYSNALEYLNEMREGLDDLANKKQQDQKTLKINELTYLKELGINLSTTEYAEIRKMASEISEFDKWLKAVAPKYFALAISRMPNWQKEGLHKLYNQSRSIVVTNTPEGLENERDNYQIEIIDEWVDGEWVVKDFKITLQGPENDYTGSKNSKYEKITPFEKNNKKNLFSFISPKNIRIQRAIKDEDGDYIKDFQGNNIKKWQERYDGFNESELLHLSKKLGDKDLAIAFMKGEDGKLGLVSILGRHKEKAKNADTYWDLQGVSQEEKENFMGKGIKFTSKESKQKYMAAEIAVYEAMVSVFPDYLTRDISNVYKRIKLPFTPMTFSDEMEDVTIKRITNEQLKNLRFVYNGKTDTDALQNIPGTGVKYLGDGGSISGRNIFEKFYKAFGLKKGTVKAKTVYYRNDDMGNSIAIKHQHSAMERLMEIFDGNTRIAYTDENGDLRLDNGDLIDMIATDDEIKILTGEKFKTEIADILTLPGSSVGFVKFSEEIPQYGKHGLQFWNHIDDIGLVSLFNQYLLPKAHSDVREMYLLLRDTNGTKALDKQLELIRKLENSDSESFMPIALGMAELGARNHGTLEPAYDKLIQNHIMSPGLKLETVPGTRLDFTPNYRGDLDKGEIAMAAQNADIVKGKYAEANNISLEDVNKLSLKVINEWLAENPVYVFAFRTPIPHVGGAMMSRVKRLHGRNGLIEINTNDVFSRFEGDFDGDELHIEMFPDEMVQPMIDFFKKNEKNITGIRLKDFVNPNESTDYSLASRKDRFRIMAALTIGRNAMGEIARVQSVYGQINQMIDSIDTPEGKIVVKKPNDKISWAPKFYKNKKGGPNNKWSGTVATFQRIMLQAAFDNNEFMLLRDWEYNQDSLYRFLFKYENGRKIDEESYETYIKPLIQNFKIAVEIRNGVSANQGKFSLLTTMQNSEKLFLFNQDMKLDYDFSVRNKITINRSEHGQNAPVFNLGLLAYTDYQEYLTKWERIGEEGTPFRLNKFLHFNAHIDAVERLDGEEYDLISRAVMKDTGLDAVGQTAYIEKESRKGIRYSIKMGKEFYRILGKVEVAGAQTQSRNEEFIIFNENFDREYKSLSETAKVYATINFLKGVVIARQEMNKKRATKTKAPHFLPPANLRKREIQTLHEGVMIKFFKYYNEVTTNPENRDMRTARRIGRYTELMDLIERFDC